MRNTDRDLTSIILVRADSPIRGIGDLKGKRIAVGAKDSPQATLIPLSFLAGQGLHPGADFEVLPFDKLSGKHGDHIGGERDAARALMSGEADAACMIDANHLLFSPEATIPSGRSRVLAQTSPYCNFTVLDGDTDLVHRFCDLLLGMSYSDPEVRPLLDMEGLKQRLPGRTSGYHALNTALERFGTVDEFVDGVASKCR